MIVQKWIKKASLIGIVLLAGGGFIAYCSAGIIKDWLTSPAQVRTILVSGNIEAHQSVLGFKTVQSRIVELPFDEGQWVKAGTVIARLDDSDYSQQVKIAEAAIEVQRRQLATTEQNLVAARKTVEADAADLEMKTADFGALIRCCRKAPARCRRATKRTRHSGSPMLPPNVTRPCSLQPSDRSSLLKPISAMQMRRSRWRKSLCVPKTLSALIAEGIA